MNRKLISIIVIILAIASLGFSKISNTLAMTKGEAFGHPGLCPAWSPATLTFLGTTPTPASQVWFTGFDGIIGEVFYPSVDRPATVDWQFLVGDKAKTWVDEEKRDTTSQTSLNDEHSLTWNVTNRAKNGKYQIQKTVFTDPKRNTLIQQVTFTALEGKLGDFNLYTLYHPAIANHGRSTTAYSSSYKGLQMLVAKSTKNNQASALASSLSFQPDKMSSGFVGHSDGWQDLKGGNADNTMDWSYKVATNGNVAQIGMFDLSAYRDRTSVTFNLVLGFGASETAAKAEAANTLNDNAANLLSTYNAQWHNYTNTLNNFGNTADQQYYVAAMVLKASQDKASGAIVAGLGNPWGNSNYANCTPFDILTQGGYHLVWPRDLYKIASALIVAGDTKTASQALDWLLNIGQQSDGHFLQNSFVDGTPYWLGVQMDETALPIVLAWKLNRTDTDTYFKHIKPAADYLVKYGPWTQQERWEENAGYSPATIAAEIAGLVCAAEIAKINGDLESQTIYLDKADYWQKMVEHWTFTTSGSIGDGKYFERIDDNGNPNDGHILNIGNGGGFHDERSIIDSSFLELVRHGVKAWNNPYILASLPEVDSTIKHNISDKGDGWFRYNNDGYGETSNGADYTGAGVGRLWPIFIGERGHYIISSGGKADAYLATMRAFANSSYMIPEQVWDLSAPSSYTSGTPTKSMTPLAWSMAEYISLLASNYTGKVMDRPNIVYQRYLGDSDS